jgi:hypothetical protein
MLKACQKCRFALFDGMDPEPATVGL